MITGSVHKKKKIVSVRQFLFFKKKKQSKRNIHELENKFFTITDLIMLHRKNAASSGVTKILIRVRGGPKKENVVTFSGDIIMMTS